MNRITGTITYGNNAEPDADDDWRRTANPWTIELRYQGRRMTVHFWTGDLAGEPTLRDVLECLASDAGTYDNTRGFEDWAADYGYDTDSRKAERMYREVERQTAKLRRLLGDDFDAIVYAEPETFPVIEPAS